MTRAFTETPSARPAAVAPLQTSAELKPHGGSHDVTDRRRRYPRSLTVILVALAAAGAVWAATASASTTVSARCTTRGTAKPSLIYLGCGAGSHIRFRITTWRSWGGPVATGDGFLEVNDCEPNCADGTFRPSAGRIQLRQRVRCGGTRRYTRAVTSGGGLPGRFRRYHWPLASCR